MTAISRSTLFGKLDALGFRTIESATVFCKLRGNPYVELEHWLHQILQGQDSDLHRIVRHFDIQGAALAGDLVDALDRLPRSGGASMDLSDQVQDAVERGWVYASLAYGATQVRTAHLLVGMLKTASLRRSLLGISRQFGRIVLDELDRDFNAILSGSPEADATARPPSEAEPGEASGAIVPGTGRESALARYTVDLTAQARQGKMDPVVGREEEIRQVMDILMRRRQNNPILTGEAGVGKTAVVEGLAQRIAAADVPPALRGVSLRTLDVGLLQAGASMKGEFEQRLRQVIDEVQNAATPVILFVDEAHTLVGAGGTAGTGDAANLLKPALARGTLRTIAATTWAEYKRHIEKDPALTRRFQPVPIGEPDEARALSMLRSLAGAMEIHHGVQIRDEALHAAVQLSKRYIADRQLPDKAVSLLDTVCARVACGQHAMPPEVDRARAAIAALEVQRARLVRDAAVALEPAADVADIDARLQREQADCAALQARWRTERELVAAICRQRALLQAGDDTAALTAQERSDGLVALARLERELAACNGERPLALTDVDRQAVAAVVQDWTGIPVGRMVGDEVQTLLQLDSRLNERVIGQAHATLGIARRIQSSRAGLDRTERPVGVFLLAGPSGVGKTETALALAEALYGGEQNLITINMSEYQESHTVSTLRGAPPGYVGYGEGGVLTEAVRRRPYSVVLLDEVEKAHPDVHEVFYQVFDRGWMEDGEGRVIDFRNTLILLTSNVGTETIGRLCANPDARPTPRETSSVLQRDLLEVFAPALLGRMTVIPYFPLERETLRGIARMQLDRLAARIDAAHGAVLSCSDAVVEAMVERCHGSSSGARLIEGVLSQELAPDIGRALLQSSREGAVCRRIDVDVDPDGFSCVFS